MDAKKPTLMITLLGAAVLTLGCLRPGSSAINPKRIPQQKPTASDFGAAAGLDEPLRRFGVALFRNRVKASPDANVFLSPVSLSQALAMTMNGAGGATRDAMAKTLALDGLPLDQANANSSALARVVAGESDGVTVRIANALWANTGVTFAPDFAARVGAGYGARTTTLDMAREGAPAINAWVSKETAGKIDSIVQPADLARATTVLTNAVYFKGTWTAPFPKEATKDGPFTVAPGSVKTLPLMRQKESLDYAEGDGYKAVRLGVGPAPKPGDANQTPVRRPALYFLLPDEDTEVSALAAKMDAQAWDAATRRRGFARRDVDLTLPRFKVEYGAAMKWPLSDLGMGIAFGGNADFAPMGLKGDAIGEVLHKAVLEVNGEGAEAAAATAVVVTRAAAQPEPPVRLVFDRPFLVAIRDDTTGALLFLGLVRDPQAL